MTKPIEDRKRVLQQVRSQFEKLIPPASIDEPSSIRDPGSDYVRVVNPIAVTRFAELQGQFLKVNAYTSPTERRKAFTAIRKFIDTERSKRGWTTRNKDYEKLIQLMGKLETLLGK